VSVIGDPYDVDLMIHKRQNEDQALRLQAAARRINTVAKRAHPLAIKEQLGHDSITTTLDKYGLLMPSLIEELMGDIGQIYTPDADTA
jgi:hypothetical protein